jgi:hypothetical protein
MKLLHGWVLKVLTDLLKFICNLNDVEQLQLRMFWKMLGKQCMGTQGQIKTIMDRLRPFLNAPTE